MSDKARTNAKWTSTDEYRNRWAEIFKKKKEQENPE
jgi:hypothetical protein